MHDSERPKTGRTGGQRNRDVIAFGFFVGFPDIWIRKTESVFGVRSKAVLKVKCHKKGYWQEYQRVKKGVWFRLQNGCRIAVTNQYTKSREHDQRC